MTFPRGGHRRQKAGARSRAFPLLPAVGQTYRPATRPINAGTCFRDLLLLLAVLWLLSILSLWALLLLHPSFFVSEPTPYPEAFNREPSVAGPNYHLHPIPTEPIWTWSNRLDPVYDDYFRITLHCDMSSHCHLEVESYRIH